MKPRILAIILAISLLVPLAKPCAAEEPPTIIVNGQTLYVDVPPANVNGRILVPARAICEALGAKVSWYDEEQSTRIARDSVEIYLPLGSQTAWVNGQAMNLDVPSQAIDGRTMVPLRFIAETMRCKVNYDPGNNTVTVDQDYFDNNYDLSAGTWLFYAQYLDQSMVFKRSQESSFMSVTMFSAPWNIRDLIIHEGWIYGCKTSSTNNETVMFRMRPDGTQLRESGFTVWSNVVYTPDGIVLDNYDGVIRRYKWDFSSSEPIVTNGYLQPGMEYSGHYTKNIVWISNDDGNMYSAPSSKPSDQKLLIAGYNYSNNNGGYSYTYYSSDEKYHYLNRYTVDSAGNYVNSVPDYIRISVKGGEPEVVFKNEYYAIMGQTDQFFFVSTPDNQVVRVAKDGSGEKLTIPNLCGYFTMKFNGDWAYLLCYEGIYRMNLDGSELIQVTNESPSEFVVYSSQS